MNKIENIIHSIKNEPWSLSVSGYIYSNKDGGDKAVDIDIEDVLSLLVSKLDEYKQRIEELEAIDPRGDISDYGVHCGLEDRGITDRYEACNYGMECVMDYIEEMIGEPTV